MVKIYSCLLLMLVACDGAGGEDAAIDFDAAPIPMDGNNPVYLDASPDVSRETSTVDGGLSFLDSGDGGCQQAQLGSSGINQPSYTIVCPLNDDGGCSEGYSNMDNDNAIPGCTWYDAGTNMASGSPQYGYVYIYSHCCIKN